MNSEQVRRLKDEELLVTFSVRRMSAEQVRSITAAALHSNYNHSFR
ncbi:hypothetical protein FHS20_001329 [Phyllobacterium endophyticum]|nr:hypothetical protein [Phyllobacterium endophyticum]